MVVTKVSEVVSKGYEWASGGPAADVPSTPLRSGNSNISNSSDIPATPRLAGITSSITDTGGGAFSSPSALWDATSTSLSSAADQAYSSFVGVANYAWESGDLDNHPQQQQQSGESLAVGGPGGDVDHSNDSWLQSLSSNHESSHLAFGSPWKLHNPYNRVRGRYAQQSHNSSLSAVRSLLPLVPMDQHDDGDGDDDGTMNDDERAHLEHEALLLLSARTNDNDNGSDLLGMDSEESGLHLRQQQQTLLDCPYTPDPLSLSDRPVRNNQTNIANNNTTTNRPSRSHQNSETASQLAEGTVRALRDIALDEAVEFHEALRYWSDRWEHPLLSWLEAGPTVWRSRHGYNHQLIGQKVAKIQAVLARRCVAIGELQQHLLRAGWQRGVAQWGVLGQGGQWATVQGTYVMTEDTAAVAAESQRQNMANNINNSPNGDLSQSLESMSALPARPVERIGMVNEHHHDHNRRSNIKHQSKRADRKAWNREKGYYASVFVRNEIDGNIHMDDAALAEWSVDAMALIRNLLERASSRDVILPYENHWKPANGKGLRHQRQMSNATLSSNNSQQGELILEEGQEEEVANPENQRREHQEDLDHQRQLPIWAKWVSKSALGNSMEMQLAADGTPIVSDEDHVVISNLPLMAAEVSELLNSIEDIMSSQRLRRMRKLRPPSMFRRRWYLTAVAAPLGTYLIHHLVTKGIASKVVEVGIAKLYKFFQEHVAIPFVAIIQEVWKGKAENMSDKKARVEVIAGLKAMILSWLDENHPEISIPDRAHMAEIMDITLIEQKKAESMKNIFELNQAVRLSFIEMQFIKKEMVNALYTMDEVMSANEINMNLAAVTPAVLLLYSAQQTFRFFYYALLRLGKSKEETYATFRQILTDIERLLVMRDNPPTSPFPLHQLRQMAGDTEDASQSHFMPHDMTGHRQGGDVLNADDLGMLMLHIHECRTILWRAYNRFTPGIIQSVSEDLAELAGERGAVSVQQQLQIISRMCRTYPFLKVISIGTTFHERFIGSSM